jgi:hypothetical protein
LRWSLLIFPRMISNHGPHPHTYPASQVGRMTGVGTDAWLYMLIHFHHQGTLVGIFENWYPTTLNSYMSYHKALSQEVL